mmetsp:Transcript_17637/g.22864  ORF Transcript_17637/g.22864 Transcript_17637/m.22864 type:complete len:160 (+) Transcript_17637:928-1407(+)
MNHIAVDNMNHKFRFSTNGSSISQEGLFNQQHQQQSSSMGDGETSSTSSSLPDHWNSVFLRRIIQHNICIVAEYYKHIILPRLAAVMQLDPATTELEISSMVSDGSVYAKIDRPASLVRFLAPKSPEAILTDWAADIDHMLRLVETTSHLINKENMTAQ